MQNVILRVCLGALATSVIGCGASDVERPDEALHAPFTSER